MKQRLISFIFLYLPLLSYSQEVMSDDKKYLEEDQNKISLVAGVSYINNSFGLRYEHQTILLKPNDSFYTEFFLRYRWLDASISFTPKLIKINNDDDVKGKTKYFNIGFAFFLSPKLRQQVGYNQIKGLYLQSTKELFLLLGGTNDLSGGYIQFPDANYRSFKGETSYLWLGNKENYRSYTNMTYKPLNNEFVVITGLFYQYNILKDSDRAVYNGELIGGGLETDATKDIKIALRSGAGIQRVIKKNWYMIAELYPQLYYSKLIGEGYNEFNFGLNSNARIGYDNGKWFFGGGAQLNWVNNSNENFYSTTQWQFRFGVGLRINSPKFVNKNFDKIDHILK
ncbi:hypothetical protein M2347_003022 [Chryseobacterium sp. H1D6B]|uniref:DUF4421 family protein n=1 Tax=Chryseobacterium sp. H1D6B TaxID=2940588 RepID=UPI0015CA3843|nr:DUF4421 family protein [Chryseobacterium sp. H1D6B]MDH6253295.1 hypothetical protein [Chryseobacterium sp. H1D6B]